MLPSEFNASICTSNCNASDADDAADAAYGGGMWIHPHWRGLMGTVPSTYNAVFGVVMILVTIIAVIGNLLVIVCFIR
jgi:hypothetical protein